MKLDDLEDLILDLANSDDGQGLIVLRQPILNDPETRKLYIALLRIPMFDQFKKVMFYDVLQQLCHKVSLLKSNKV